MSGSNLSQETKAKTQERVGPPLPRPEDLQQPAAEKTNDALKIPSVNKYRRQAEHAAEKAAIVTNIAVPNAQFTEAIKSVNKILIAGDAAKGKINLADNLAAVGDTASAKIALKSAVKSAGSESHNKDLFKELAKSHSRLGNHMAAIQFAADNLDAYGQADVLGYCAKSILSGEGVSKHADSLAADLISQAQNNLAEAKYPYQQPNGLLRLATQLQEAGQSSKSMSILKDVENQLDAYRAKSLLGGFGTRDRMSRLATCYAKNGAFNDATRVASKLNYQGYMCEAYMDIADEMKAQGLPQADQIGVLNKAMENTSLLGRLDRTSKQSRVIARLIAAGEDPEKVSELLEVNKRDALLSEHHQFRDEGIARIGRCLAKNGDYVGAIEMISKVEKMEFRLPNQLYLGRLMHGQGVNHSKIFRMAKITANRYSIDKSPGYQALAKSFAMIGEFEEAKKTSLNITQPGVLSQCQTDIALEMHKAGKVDDATEMLAMAEKSALAIKDYQYVETKRSNKDRQSRKSTAAFKKLGEGLAEVGEFDKAAEALSRIENASVRAETQAFLGKQIELAKE